MHRGRIKGVSVSDRPRCANLCLHIGEKYVGDKAVARHAGEKRVDVVLVDKDGVLRIFRKVVDSILMWGTS